MHPTWYSATMLAIESSGVIGLRLMKLAGGGTDAQDEAGLMVREKVDAALEAGASLIGGASPGAVVERYREHVAANSLRLSR